MSHLHLQHYLVAEYFITAPADMTPEDIYAKSKQEQADLVSVSYTSLTLTPIYALYIPAVAPPLPEH